VGREKAGGESPQRPTIAQLIVCIFPALARRFLNAFFWRAVFVEADASLLLIDASLTETSKAFRTASNHLRRFGFLKQEVSTGEAYWVKTGPTHAVGPGGQTLSRNVRSGWSNLFINKDKNTNMCSHLSFF
jgi:hypothetical protein